MKQLVFIFVVLASAIPTMHCLVQQFIYPGQSKTLYIGPDNIKALASYLDNSLVVEDRAIVFGTGVIWEKLIEVPLGFVHPDSTIRVTVGLDDTAPSAPVQEHDPLIGISDGNFLNEFCLFDVANYQWGAPCYPQDALSQDDRRVSERTHAPAQATMIFRPLRKYGACYLPLDGGYVNTATFTNQLDTSRALSFTVRRQEAFEWYRFHYFILEIF